MSRVLRPCGAHAVLVEFDDPAELVAVAAAWRDAPPPGVLDVVPGARTVLLDAASDVDLDALRAAALAEAGRPPTAASVPPVEIPVVYDGPDLADVARLTRLTAAGVVDAHTGATWTVAFCGFAPGFAYLTTPGRALHVPRRDTPRTRVPLGSVGLAGGYSGVYPTASPGGWQLIGRTDVTLFDVERNPPAMLAPGTRVRFVAR